MPIITKNTDTTCQTTPLLSIVCPAYNQEAFVAQRWMGFCHSRPASATKS